MRNIFYSVMNKEIISNYIPLLVLSMLFALIFTSCNGRNNGNGNITEPDMPAFAQKFPQKHIHVNDSVELTFSSMEEAEWKLLPKAIDDIANGRLVMENGRAVRKA